VLTNFASAQLSQYAEFRPSPPRSSHDPGPPQVAAPITGCHNPSFDCASRLRTPASPSVLAQGAPVTNHQFTLSFGEGAPFFLGVANNGNAR
jgi:hypothetical protein